MIYTSVPSIYSLGEEVGYNTDDFHSLDPEALSVLNWINTHDPHSMDYDEEDSVSPIEVEGGSKEEDIITEEQPAYKIITPDMIGFMGGIPVKSNGRISQIINLSPSVDSAVGKNGVDYKFSNKSEFKSKMLDVYRKVLREKGISEEFARSLVGQDALESAWGSKVSGKNNFGGIKGKGTTKRTREVINGKDVYINDSFRDFSSLEEYARYKVNLLNNSRYRAFDGGVSDFSRRVAGGGYATDPRYRDVLEKFIRSVKKGGKILKGNTGMVFVNESGDESRPSVNPYYGTMVLEDFRNTKDKYDYSSSPVGPTDGHWNSRNPETGQMLKDESHPTRFYEDMASKRLGLKRYIDIRDGREYTFDKTQVATKGNLPWMKEVEYNKPTLDLYGNKAKEAIRIYKKLLKDGYDPKQSAGLVGVFMQESSLDHSKVSDAGATGIGQLKDDKLDRYYRWLKKTGRPDNSDSQIDWIMDHVNYGKDDWKDYYYSLMENSRDDFARLPKDQRDKARRDWALMENSKYADYDYESFRDTFYNVSLSPGDVAELFTWTFERPGEDEANIEQRKRYAEQLYYYMNSGN